jgi:hypothetical protein
MFAPVRAFSTLTRVVQAPAATSKVLSSASQQITTESSSNQKSNYIFDMI